MIKRWSSMVDLKPPSDHVARGEAVPASSIILPDTPRPCGVAGRSNQTRTATISPMLRRPMKARRRLRSCVEERRMIDRQAGSFHQNTRKTKASWKMKPVFRIGWMVGFPCGTVDLLLQMKDHRRDAAGTSPHCLAFCPTYLSERCHYEHDE